MPLWFCVLFLLFVPVICWISVVLGAYLMWCREKGANPLTDVKSFVLPGGVTIRREEEQEGGFYG